MKLLTPALAYLLLAAAAAPAQRLTAPTPARASDSPTAVQRVSLSGRRLFAAERGDFVHPALSPDGTRLAYSKVVLVGKREGTEVLLRDLRSGRTSVLLGRRAAERYATYSVFVTGIEWQGDQLLRVRVADGDVDATDLLFDTRSRRLLRETDIEPGFEDDGSGHATPVPADFKRAHARARALFPSLADDLLRHSLHNGAFLVGDRGLVLQKNHVGEDDNVWLLDFERRAMRPLIDLKRSASYRLAGGFAFGPSILFLVSNGVDAVLYEHRDGRLTKLLRTPVKTACEAAVEVKHLSPERAVFLLRTAASYETGDNPLLTFDGARLRRAADYPALHDASIDARGRLVAFSFWRGDVRRLAVGKLKD